MNALRFVLLGCLLLAGCSSLSTNHDAAARNVKRIYVEHLLTDNYRTDQAIVTELKALGYEASCGPITMIPDGVDAVINYRQRTAWDFKSYLIELNVEMKANFSGKTIATGRYYQAAVTTKSPDEVVHAVISRMLPRR